MTGGMQEIIWGVAKAREWRFPTKDKRDKGAADICPKNEKIADIYQNVKFDRVVLTFVSKILGSRIFIVGIILFLEIVGLVGWVGGKS